MVEVNGDELKRISQEISGLTERVTTLEADMKNEAKNQTKTLEALNAHMTGQSETSKEIFQKLNSVEVNQATSEAERKTARKTEEAIRARSYRLNNFLLAIIVVLIPIAAIVLGVKS